MEFKHARVVRSHRRPSGLCIGNTKSGGHYLAMDVTQLPAERHPVGAALLAARSIKWSNRGLPRMQTEEGGSTIDPALSALIVANQAVQPLNDGRTPLTASAEAACAMAYITPLNGRYITGRATGGCSLTVVSREGTAHVRPNADPGALTGRAHIPAGSAAIRLEVENGDLVVLSTPAARRLVGSDEFALRASGGDRSFRKWIARQAPPADFGLSIVQIMA